MICSRCFLISARRIRHILRKDESGHVRGPIRIQATKNILASPFPKWIGRPRCISQVDNYVSLRTRTTS